MTITPRRRVQAILLFLLMVAAGLLELLTIGSLAPFLAIVMDPHALERSGRLLHGLHLAEMPPRQGILLVACVFGGSALAAAVARVALSWATQYFGYRLGYDLEVLAFETALNRPYGEQIRRNSSETISTLDKVGEISRTVFLPILIGVSSTIIAVCILTALIVVRPVEALVALAGFGSAYVALSLLVRGRLVSASRVVSLTQNRRIQNLQEGLGGIRDIILDGSQPLHARRFGDTNLALRNAQAAIAVISATPRFAIEGAGMLVIAGLVVWLSNQPGGVLSAVPLLAALALAAQRLLPLLQQIYNSWSAVAGSRQAVADVAALLGHAPRALGDSPAVQPAVFRDRLELCDVEFAYGAAPVLRGLSLTVQKGARVGLVGRSGSGKSTLTDIVLGLLEPQAGEVRLDGQVMDAEGRARWRRTVAHVPQFIFLSDATILENIAFGSGSEAPDRARAEDAAMRADLGQLIAGMPQGIDSVVGERGIFLSGGQRQRIGIARALYRRSQVLVLDEATSALDDATEDAVLDAVAGLDRSLTVIMVAHRLRTLRVCDTIYRLEGGRMVEEGPYKAFTQRRA